MSSPNIPRRPSGLAKRVSSRPTAQHRQSSTFRYHTFPTAPPRQSDAIRRLPSGLVQENRTRNRDMGSDQDDRDRDDSQTRKPSSSRHRHDDHEATPLPKGQLAVLAIIALAEQTALNSISPYLPAMASTFPEVDNAQVGMYVGLIASAFALAQFLTGFAWGWLSDRVGRKPIVLLGTLLTAGSFVAFGFCRTLWQAVLVQVIMGLVNGNQGVISTCLGEITDRSNQSQAFTYLPVIYGLGGITGPIVGGLLVTRKIPFTNGKENPYPYLFPNLFSAAVLLIDFVVAAFFLEESLETADDLPPLNRRFRNLFAWLWQFGGNASKPTYVRRASKNGQESDGTDQSGSRQSDTNTHNGHHDNDDADENTELLHHVVPESLEVLVKDHVLKRDTILLLITFLIFQLANVGYNSLYPIFAQASPPIGRDLSPEEIGISLAFAGAITIIFQVGLFGRLREKIGNRVTYRISQFGFVLAFILMPWVGYKDGSSAGRGPPVTHGKVWLWIELGVVLIIKTVASVGGLTSALLLITNSAPSHAVLGTLNGLAQTLSAAGRAVGPFISGALFTASVHVKPKGEALAFGIFAAVSLIGFALSFGIRGAELEAEGWESEEDEDEDEDEEAGNGRR